MRNLKIEPGMTFTFQPESFVRGKQITKIDAENNVKTSLENPMVNQKYWMPFPNKSDLAIRVAVEFADGEKWYNDNQGGKK